MSTRIPVKINAEQLGRHREITPMVETASLILGEALLKIPKLAFAYPWSQESGVRKTGYGGPTRSDQT